MLLAGHLAVSCLGWKELLPYRLCGLFCWVNHQGAILISFSFSEQRLRRPSVSALSGSFQPFRKQHIYHGRFWTAKAKCPLSKRNKLHILSLYLALYSKAFLQKGFILNIQVESIEEHCFSTRSLLSGMCRKKRKVSLTRPCHPWENCWLLSSNWWGWTKAWFYWHPFSVYHGFSKL